MATLDTIIDAVERALIGPCEVPPGTPLVAACSGGADSVALVHALGALAGRWSLSAVAFVDHGLRDISADRAAAIAAAEAVGAPFLSLSVSLPGGGNLQAEARHERYLALLRHLPPGGVLATGHTLSDQAETVLQRLIRGAGLRGLRAIPWRDGPVVRPLLEVSRETTRGAALNFADDPSNERDGYLRNRLRRRVMPLLAAENPRVEAALAAVADQARVELELIDALAERVALSAADLSGAPVEIAETLIRWRHRYEIGGLPPRRAPVAELARRLVAGGPSSSVSLGRGYRGVADRGHLELSGEQDPRSEVVAWGPGTYRLAHSRLELVYSDHLSGRSDAEEADVIQIPADRLRWPLRVMSRGAGQMLSSGWVGRLAEDRSGRPVVCGETARRLVVRDSLGERLWPPTERRGDRAAEERGAVTRWLRLTRFPRGSR